MAGMFSATHKCGKWFILISYLLGKSSVMENMTRYGAYDFRYGFGVLENWSHDAYGGRAASARPGSSRGEGDLTI